MKTDERKCKNPKCGEIHSKKAIKRVFGEESMVYIGGYCSSHCYTEVANNKKSNTPTSTINWIPVKSGQLPIKSEKAYKETLSEGFSDKVLAFCSDATIRMARYHNQLECWIVDSCSSSFSDFVRYWAVNITEEAEKLKLREKLKQADKEMDTHS